MHVVKLVGEATVSDVLHTVYYGIGCTLQLYDEHNICLSNSELVGNLL